LTLYFSGEKTYDKDGSSQGRTAKVSIKITDSAGYVFDSTTFYTPSLFVGDKFSKQECKIFDLPKGDYSIELINTN